MATVEEPSVVQVVPLGEVAAVKKLPTRVNRFHAGAKAAVAEEVVVDDPPTVEREVNLTPLDMVGVSDTCLEFGAVLSRILIPALAVELVFVMEATRAMIDPSPVRVCIANCISSLVPEMSAPEAPNKKLFVEE